MMERRGSVLLAAVAALVAGSLMFTSPATAGGPDGPGSDIPASPDAPPPTAPGPIDIPTELPPPPPYTPPAFPDPPQPPPVPVETPGQELNLVHLSLYPSGPGEICSLRMWMTGDVPVTSFGYRIGDADEIVVPALDRNAYADAALDVGTTTITVRAFDGDTVLDVTSADFTL